VLKIGSFQHPSRVIVAPMAGVTDRPFRQVCRAQGAHWMIAEMVTSNTSLWSSDKSRARLPDINEAGPRWVQILGTEPEEMAEAARANVDFGAQIIDINMGCPAKKVCRKLAGSALMRDERLVSDILSAVVSAVNVPVTLKMRLGWSKDTMNAVTIAKIAEDAGIQLLSVHGRTRECRFKGPVDYEEIGRVKSSVNIPVIANGDIVCPDQVVSLVRTFGFDGVMIGRGILGKPWLVEKINGALAGENKGLIMSVAQWKELLTTHLMLLNEFYGGNRSVRIARKHIGWYLGHVANGIDMAREFNRLSDSLQQKDYIKKIDAVSFGGGLSRHSSDLQK